MNSKSTTSGRLLTTFALLAGSQAHAANSYWDPNGATAGTGGTGSWITALTPTRWRAGSDVGALEAWVNGNAAFLGGTYGTITTNAAIEANQINVVAGTTGTAPYSIVNGTGGSIAFAGASNQVNVPSGHSLSITPRVLVGTGGGLVTVQGGGTLTMGSSGRAYNGNMKVTGAGTVLAFSAVNGLDNNTNTIGLTADAGGTIRLDATNNHRNTTLILSSGTLNLTSSSVNGLAMQNGSAITVNGGVGSVKSSIIGSAGAGNTAVITANGAARVITVNDTEDPSGFDLEVSASSGLMALRGNAGNSGSIQKNGAGVMRLMPTAYISNYQVPTFDYAKLSLHVNAGTFQNEGRVYSMTTIGNNATARTGAAAGSYDAVTVNSGGTFELSRATGSFTDGIIYGSGQNALTLNGGSLKYVGLNTDISAQINEFASGTSGIVNTNGESVIFATPLAGEGGLTKAGSGTLTLNSSNTFTGPTSVEGGTLAFGTSGSLASLVIAVTDGGTLDTTGLPGGLTMNAAGNLFTGIGTSTVSGNLTLGANAGIAPGGIGFIGNSVINGNLVLAGSYNVDIVSPGSDLVTVSGNANLTGAVIRPVSAGPIDPATYTIFNYGTRTGTPVLDPAFASSRYNPTLNLGTPGTITLSVTGNAADLVWTGKDSGVWNNGSAQNWKNGAADDVFKPLDYVQFDDDALGNFTLSLTEEVTPSDMVFANMDEDYLITGGGFISGLGGLSKTGTGSVILATDNTFSGPIFNDGGILQIGNGGATGAIGGGNLANAGQLIVDRTGNLTLSNLISGPGTLEKRGAGKLTLASTNTYQGTTTVTGGTLSIAADNRLGAAPGVLTPGHLTLNGTLEVTGVTTLNANRGLVVGPLDAAGSAVIDTAFPYTATDFVTYNGVIGNNGPAGTGGLIKTGSGSLQLGGSNTYSGPTLVEAGSLRIAKPDALGASTSGTTVADGALLYFISGAHTSPVTEPLSLAGNGEGVGALRVGGGVRHTLSSPITLTASTTIRSDSTAAIDLTDTVTGTNTDLTFYNGTSLNSTLGGSLSLGTGRFTKDGGVVTILAADNTYGPTTIAAATLQIGTGGITGTLGSGPVTNNGVLAFNRSDSSTVANEITGTGALTLAGGGTFTLTGTNSYAGTTNVNAATLVLSGTHSGGGNYSVATGAALAGNGATASQVTVAGAVSPGAGIGIGTLSTGPLVLNTGALLDFEIDTSTVTSDKIMVTGNVTRPGTTVDLLLNDIGANAALADGTKFTLIDYSGTWNLTSVVRFAGSPVPDHSTITVGANVFTVRYNDGGALTLTAGILPFQTWVDGFIANLPNAADRLPGADPDMDGRDNLLEFALNGDPSNVANPGKMSLSTDDSNDAGTARDLSLTLAVRDGAALSTGPDGSAILTVDGIVYAIQGSATLQTFNSPVSEISPASTLSPAPSAGWTARTFRLDSSDGLPGTGFLRVSVTE